MLAGHDHHYEQILVDKTPYVVNGLNARNIYRVTMQRLPQSKTTFNADFGGPCSSMPSRQPLPAVLYPPPGAGGHLSAVPNPEHCDHPVSRESQSLRGKHESIVLATQRGHRSIADA
jgi:hypothetical protein